MVIRDATVGMTTNSISENLQTWNETHPWPEDGDEWKGQAAVCGVPYGDWKQSLVEHLIVPYAGAGSAILEIGPGHGRWTEYLARAAGRLILADLSPNCLEHCRRRFAGADHLEYHVTDGRSLPAGLDDSVDLVWSFDAMVHVGPEDFRAYLQHIARVLKPGGRAVLHHANRWHGTLWLAGLRRFGPRATLLYRAISIGLQERIDGWRSPVSARRVRRYAGEAGLEVVMQCQRWGADNRYGVPRFNDRVTILCKPAP